MCVVESRPPEEDDEDAERERQRERERARERERERAASGLGKDEGRSEMTFKSSTPGFSKKSPGF